MEKAQFFMAYPLIPGEEAVDGILFDFCDGCRILFPNGLGEHRVVLTDLDSGIVLEDVECCDGAKFRSRIRYYVNWNVRIYRNGSLIFDHSLDLEGREVLFTMNTDAIGDTIAWFGYVDAFQKKHKCFAGIVMGEKLRPIFESEYPNIAFFERGMEKALAPYAGFLLGINYECSPQFQKRAFNSMPLHHLVGADLGFDNDELEIEPPHIKTVAPLIGSQYACLSLCGSMKCKEWNNPTAIAETVEYLKSRGLRVLVCDRENHGLYGAEDFTGDRPLVERATLFKYANMFIGMSSGLSWIAWAARAPVLLISGFTEPWVEFSTPYRVQNANVCHGCWNNLKLCYTTEGSRDTWCPAKKDFECTRKITSKMVIRQIDRILGEKK